MTVYPYTFISIILCSFMIECRNLALNHLLQVGGSWDSFEPNGKGLTSLQSLPRFWAYPTSVWEVIIYQRKFVINSYKKISINGKKDSAHIACLLS